MPDADALRNEVARLRAENAGLREQAAQARSSASAQALRAGLQGGDAHLLRRQMETMRASRFWRLTMPLRVAVDVLRGAPPTSSAEALLVRRAVGVAKRQGLGAAVAQVRGHLRRRALAAPRLKAAAAEAPLGTVPPPNTLLAPAVVIIAELTLPQCAKYRVWQKQEHFALLGVPCRVINWHHTQECLSAAATATMAILYRVPAFPPVLRLIETLHQLHVPVFWEVDDLIFDATQFLENRNLETLDQASHEGVLSGVDFYRDAMLACGRGIASTAPLAAAMRGAGLGEVALVENALDADTLALAERIHAARPPHDGVVVAYGSGTKTHDADFRQAAPALLQLLAARPEVQLRIIGDLNLPPAFAAFESRVEHLPRTHFARYLAMLGESDINIAPLEPTRFNDAKSNIKFLEAAILDVPSICSPAANFADLVRQGETGLLAQDDSAWFAALDLLAGDTPLRARLGEAARQAVLHRYAPAAVAHSQVAPLLTHMQDARQSGKLRVLLANVYYAPRSYGGATLVVEEMATRMHARADTEVHVVTALPEQVEPRRIVRRDQDGIAVFELPVASQDAVAEFDDPLAGDAFGQVLDAMRPDVVHLHSVQWLSASAAAACRDRNIPYAITLHDAWWVCARQFMVRLDGNYCHQTKIDLRVCQDCMPGARYLQARQSLLRAALDGAAVLISPSEAHKNLYTANGIEPAKIVVMPNGIRLPEKPPARTRGPRLRLAYVGGNVEVKGFSIVRRAFEGLNRGDWDLTLVDNTLNLGFCSVDASAWRVRGNIRTVPAYTQDGMDAFFAQIDVLLFPSQWKESFGLTVREALARHVWVIATEGGGPADAIEEGVNGNLIPLDGRADSLQQRIEALLDRPGLLAGYGNPRAGDVRGFAEQAEQLRALLAGLARTEPPPGPPTTPQTPLLEPVSA